MLLSCDLCCELLIDCGGVCGALSVLVEARLRRRAPLQIWLDNAGHVCIFVDLAVVPGRGGVAQHNGDFRKR